MTTDYKKLTLFEAGAVMMIAVGIALIAVQVFVSLPGDAQAKVTSALQIFEMSDAAAEAWSVEVAFNDYAFNGMEDFYHEFYVALAEVVQPVADSIASTAHDYAQVARAFTSMSDNIASNYQNNYVEPGVEAGMGGRVLGAYILKLSE